MGTHLIVGQAPDTHVDALEVEIKKRGGDVFRLHASKPDEPSPKFVFEMSERARSVRLEYDGRSVDGSDVETVFWRLKSPVLGLPSNDKDRFDQDFRFREWRAAIAGLNSAVDHALWVNPYEKHTYGSTKVLQLNVAHDVGLMIPKTVVGNDDQGVLKLYESGEVIYKTLSNPFYSPDQVIMTKKISRSEFDESRGAIKAAPCLFQQHVEKAYELRITIIGDSMAAVRVDSQAKEETKMDWRVWQLRKEMYSVVEELPKDVVRGLKALMSKLGLIYGAVDMIVTPAGEHVFLEVNPGGQWLWMEELIGVPITAEIAHYLVHRESLRFGTSTNAQMATASAA